MAVVAARELVDGRARLGGRADDHCVADDVDRRAPMGIGEPGERVVPDLGLGRRQRACDVDRIDVVRERSIVGVSDLARAEVIGCEGVIAVRPPVAVVEQRHRVRPKGHAVVVAFAEAGSPWLIGVSAAVDVQLDVGIPPVHGGADDQQIDVVVARTRNVPGHGAVCVVVVPACARVSARGVGVGDEGVRSNQPAVRSIAFADRPGADTVVALARHEHTVPVRWCEGVPVRGVVRQAVVIRHQQPVLVPETAAQAVHHRAARRAEV